MLRSACPANVERAECPGEAKRAGYPTKTEEARRSAKAEGVGCPAKAVEGRNELVEDRLMEDLRDDHGNFGWLITKIDRRITQVCRLL